MLEPNAYLISLIRRDALKMGTFTLASGRTSRYYLDMRQVTLTSDGAGAIAGMIFEVMFEIADESTRIDAIGGPTIGSAPIVGAMLAEAVSQPFPWADIRGFLARPEAKAHGMGGRIIGPLRAGDRVVIVDDVATSGGSILGAIDAVVAFGCRVGGVIVVLDRCEGAREAIEGRGYPFHALVTVRDLGIEPEVRS